MITHARRTATLLAVVGAAGLGGSAIAGATSPRDSTASGTGTAATAQRGDARPALATEDAAKVKAAALAKVPGATVLRTEAGGPYSTPYHAHVRTSDATRQVVLVDAGFTATTVQADDRRRGGPRGPR